MKEKLIYIATIVILFIAMAISINKCTSYRNEYYGNLIALSDSIHYYKTKSGQLVATTKLYETDIKHLKYLNDSLYNQIKSLKNKNITQATQFSGTIENPQHDTTFVLVTDTSLFALERFKFENQYRLLEGTIRADQNEINMKIEKDVVHFNYTVALDKNNNVLITSNNPYIKYNSISGFTLPKPRKKRFSVGPYFGAGIDVRTGKIDPQVGIGLSYGLIQF